MALITQITNKVVANLTGSGDLGAPSATLILSFLDTLEDGTTNAQADMGWGDTRTVALSDSEVLDFGSGGGLVNVFGGAFEPAEIVLLAVHALPANTNSVRVGNNTEPFLGPMLGTTPTTDVKPGGILMWYAPAGWAVANNSSDKLKMLNSGAGTSVTYSILVIGRSA
jgi:hypothetical protein